MVVRTSTLWTDTHVVHILLPAVWLVRLCRRQTMVITCKVCCGRYDMINYTNTHAELFYTLICSCIQRNCYSPSRGGVVLFTSHVFPKIACLSFHHRGRRALSSQRCNCPLEDHAVSKTHRTNRAVWKEILLLHYYERRSHYLIM